MEQRKEQRVSWDKVSFPFLGSRDGDHACFEYLIVDFSPAGARIAVPNWVVNRDLLRTGDVVNFHLPFRIGSDFYDRGTVVWARWDDEIQSQACGISVHDRDDTWRPVPPDMTVDTFLHLLKDSMLLKKGVSVYFGHLIPLLSRITTYSRKEYPEFKEAFLEDVRRRIRDHHGVLLSLYEKAKGGIRTLAEIPVFIDLEDFRGAIESEIHMVVFEIAFSDEHATPYLNSIKKLEERLYSNYNGIVMLYSRSLEKG